MAKNDFSQLLDEYLVRLQAGETIERIELEEEHPQEAVRLWRQIAAWKDVAGALPGTPPPDTGSGAHGKQPAIRFHSIGGAAAAEDLLKSAHDPVQLARRIAERGESIGRYQVVEEIARGAMGAILRVVDTDLGRELAMKVMLGKELDSGEEDGHEVPGAAVARFVEEARITGRLEHPGIPPVHDFGVDSEGNFYFTMLRVRGHTLRDVFRRVRKKSDGWSRARALGLLMQVCDALAYAHAQGVVHRDLKPRNVMVGEFGEVYVMDWGLARDLERADAADIRLVTPDHDDGSPIRTREGVVIGTPCYMSPEQARGDVAQVGPRTDVYALGAILYKLLAGHPPYAPHGSKTPAYGVVKQVKSGPPVSVLAESKRVPAELAAICERAMAREPAQRFADVGELAKELRAFLEGRVVKSYATGAWIELRKWVGRNRGVAVLSGLLFVAALTGSLMLASLERSRRAVVERELDVQLAENLVQSADQLGLVGPGAVERLQAWMDASTELASRQAYHVSELLVFEAAHESVSKSTDPGAQLPFDPARLAHRQEQRRYWEQELTTERAELEGLEEGDQARSLRRSIEILERELSQLQGVRARLELQLAAVRSWRYEDPEVDRTHRHLWKLKSDLERLTHPELGTIAIMRERLDEARGLQDRTLEEHREDWQRAIASIRNELECPLYEGLVLEPRVGLVPLGRNAQGLWEFWHVLSGDRPSEREPGLYEIAPESGMVFVLVPGGERAVGAQCEDSSGLNYCSLEFIRAPRLMRDEGPVRRPRLAPYYLSKYEMTQAQWVRLTGSNTSKRFAGTGFTGAERVSATHPVEHLSWSECALALPRWGLGLPTEAQWEVAARADTPGPFWWGDAWPPSEGSVNFSDRSLAEARSGEEHADMPQDGYAIHAPVDTMLQNPWGFHHITGNVGEWCRDWFKADCYGAEIREGSGEVVPAYSSTKAFRGGSYMDESPGLRASRRPASRPEKREEDVGVRPVFSAFE